MPRFVPRVDHRCRICDTTFALLTDYDDSTGHLTTEPRVCPACAAPLIFAPAPSIGKAKSLLLTALGVPSYVKENGSVTDFLRAHSPRAEDVDTYMDLVTRMDYDAWEAMNRESRKGKPTATQRQEEQAVTRLRARMAAGDLLLGLAAAAQRVKDERLAERAHHLALFATKNGGEAR